MSKTEEAIDWANKALAWTKEPPYRKLPHRKPALLYRVGNVVVDRLPLIVVLGAQEARLRGERLRRLVGFESQEELLFQLGFIGLSQSSGIGKRKCTVSAAPGGIKRT